MRETQALLGWLDGVDRTRIDGGTGALVVGAQPDGPWWALLREAVSSTCWK